MCCVREAVIPGLASSSPPHRAASAQDGSAAAAPRRPCHGTTSKTFTSSPAGYTQPHTLEGQQAQQGKASAARCGCMVYASPATDQILRPESDVCSNLSSRTLHIYSLKLSPKPNSSLAFNPVVNLSRLPLTCRPGWTAAVGGRPASGPATSESRGVRRRSRLLRCLSRPSPHSSCTKISHVSCSVHLFLPASPTVASTLSVSSHARQSMRS